MPLETQAVLLRVLENKQVMRVGGKEYRPIDFRLIASTNKDLQAAVKNGQFRQDLYYRLNVLTVNIPPLRQRGRDVISLAEYFINNYYDDRYGKTKKHQLSTATKDILLKYHWPGNIRQLENAMVYALNIDLKAPFRICRRAVPTMVKGGGGSIVNIGSYAALRGNHGPSYTSAKAGVVGLTKSIAFAYGKQGIRCNIIHPGGTRTDIGAHSGGDYHLAGQALSKIVAAMPVNWFGMPDDIVRACFILVQ